MSNHAISPTWRTFARSSSSADGAAENQASRISRSSASLVARSDSASTLASFHRRAPDAVTARRRDRAGAGAEVESALAPGRGALKTFDAPLDALAGRTVTRVRRAGKMLVVECGELALLVHLMSAGRLQLYGVRASLRD